jgi:hypothetical protein
VFGNHYNTGKHDGQGNQDKHGKQGNEATHGNFMLG